VLTDILGLTEYERDDFISTVLIEDSKMGWKSFPRIPLFINNGRFL
jgi:hypothetical protein